MKERQEAQELSTAVKAQNLREKWQEKLSQAGRKKEEQLVAKILASEEQHLKLVDAQARVLHEGCVLSASEALAVLSRQ